MEYAFAILASWLILLTAFEIVLFIIFLSFFLLYRYYTRDSLEINTVHMFFLEFFREQILCQSFGKIDKIALEYCPKLLWHKYLGQKLPALPFWQIVSYTYVY